MEQNTNVTVVKHKNRGAGEGVYGLGMIGALVYYIQHAHSFWEGLLGVLKALIWPAILIYRVLEFIYK